MGEKPNIVPVLLPLPTERAYSYRVAENMHLVPGDIVRVPLGPRMVAAVVWDGDVDPVDPAKLRDVEHKFDCPPLSPDLRKFVDWIARYTLTPPGMVLRMFLRVPAAFDPEPLGEGWQLTGELPQRMTDARRRVVALAENGLTWSKSGLSHAAGVSAGVVSGLIKQGSLTSHALPPIPAVENADPDYQKIQLSDEQIVAADGSVLRVKANEYSATLLEGITGSGKTEVYFEAVAEALRQGRQVLILLPEIALTTAFVERFERRFGAKPAEWHSGMNPKRREKVWRQIATGQVRVVAGARSALFLPLNELGLIIVDEEHDSAYKQEDRVFYNARDMAVVRASISKFPVILASATPSLESQVNAEQGRYHHARLSQRHADAQLPKITVVDLRKDPPPRGAFLSPALIEAVGQAVENKTQALLFLNRRGYAPLTLCRICGHRFQCDNCSAWLVEHRYRRQLQCHHCGHNEPTPEACPSCGTLDHLVACGPGVERVAEEIVAHFPDARTLLLSSDMAGGITRLRLELEAIVKGEADIIIGTQLVAKGHHFPLISCVGVVDADIGLSNGDPRAAERTFQLLSQVTGRAGREGGESIGIIQSYLPEHPVIKALANGDSEEFYQREIAARKGVGLPPFGRLASIIVSASERPVAEAHARAMRSALPPVQDVSSEIKVLGPAEAPMALIRGRYRFRLLVQTGRSVDLQQFLRDWLAETPKPRGNVRVQIDVDPQSFL